MIIKDIQYIKSLYKIIKGNDFDIVINIATKANVYGTFVSKYLGIPRIVCSVWGLGVIFSEDKSLKRKLIKYFKVCSH